jgi:hypothetical protein
MILLGVVVGEDERRKELRYRAVVAGEHRPDAGGLEAPGGP